MPSRLLSLVFLLLLIPQSAFAYAITSYLEMVKVSAVGYTWKTIPLSNSYTNPVVVCTYNLPSDLSNEAAVRVQQVGAAIQVKVQRPLDVNAVTASDVYCTISEEGSYTYPIKYEAHTVTSTNTNYRYDWSFANTVDVSSSPNKVQTYTQPVVLGQVMSYNNPNFSVFWTSRCNSRTNPPTDASICIGKHTGESTPTAPSTETLGYIIAEEGEYILANSYVHIELGSDTVTGVGNSPPYTYALSRSYSYATVTKAAEDGGQGGWAVLYGGSPVGSSLDLAIDEETVAGDTSRGHTTEQVSYWVMEPITKTYADLQINEILYRQTTGLNEFIEFYVLSGGSILNYLVSSQDGTGQNYRLPDVTVNAGDYVVLHSAVGTTSSAGGVHHVYSQSTATPLNNSSDDVVLLKPSSSDATALNGSGFYNVIPVDYVAYGASADAVPVSENGVTVSWNAVDNARLAGVVAGQSISLTPNGVDTDTSVCWEKTQSGDASACPSFIISADTDASSLINSQGVDNNIAPEITLSKSVLTIYDPYNGASNPKAIPGSVLEYTITAVNNGPLAADNNSINITDAVPANTKLCVSNTGYCEAPSLVDGSPSSGLTFAANNYSDNDASSFIYPASGDADGADSSVTHLQVTTSGAFQPKTGATGSTFSVKFRIVVE